MKLLGEQSAQNFVVKNGREKTRVGLQYVQNLPNSIQDDEPTEDVVENFDIIVFK